MQCSEAREHVSAYIDGEVARGDDHAIKAHVAACPACAELAGDYRRISRELASGYERAPADLEDKIRARLDAEDSAPAARWYADWRRWARQAAVVVVAAGLSALLTWQWTLSSAQNAGLEREVVAAHVRSLLQENTTQVASSDRHTVKPWFNGRLDFAPAVKDLAAEGYPLIGGRLDLIGDRRIAVVVYKRRHHVINVFMWPSAGAEAANPRLSAVKGYNALTWTAGGIAYWAVSDLNAPELGELQKLL
jgi:anti-sigma factor (TIGR02949 family)